MHWRILGILWKFSGLIGLCFDGLSTSYAERALVGDKGRWLAATDIAVRQARWGVTREIHRIPTRQEPHRDGAGRGEMLGAIADSREYIRPGTKETPPRGPGVVRPDASYIEVPGYV